MKSLLTRAVIFLSILMLGMLASLNIGFYFFFNKFDNNTDELVFSSSQKLTEQAIADKCADISRQIEIFLTLNTIKKLKQLRSDDTFIRIITQKICSTGYLALFDQNGKIIFHPQHFFINQSYTILKNRSEKLFNIISNAFSKKNAQGYYTFQDSQGQAVKKFITAKKIDYNGWVLSVINDTGIFTKPFLEINKQKKLLKKNTFTSFVILSILWCTIIILLTYVFIRRMTTNINILTEQAVNINLENLEFYTPQTKIKEIHELGNAIEKMTERLKHSFQSNLTLQEEMTHTVVTLNNIIDSAVRYGIIVTDENGNIEIFNNGAEILFNYTADEIKKRSITLIHEPGDLENKGFEYYLEKSEDEGYFDRNMTAIRKDGTRFPMSIHASIRSNAEMDFEGFVIILYDRTEEKIANSFKIQNEYQAEQLQNIEIIINSLPIGIIVTDENSEVVIENDAARNILCFKEGITSVGLNLLEMKAFKHPVITDIMQKTIHRNEHHILRDVKYLPAGCNKTVYLDINFTPLINLEGVNNGSIISFEDKTLLTLSIKKMQELDTIIYKSPVIAYKLSANKAYSFEYISENVRMFGYKPEELYKPELNLLKMTYKEDKDNVKSCLESAENCTHQFRITTKLGNVRWIENTLWFHKSPNNVITDIQGIVTDITERKTAEEEYKKAQKIIERQVSILKKYVDQSVLDFMMDENGDDNFNLLKSEVINATICFIDICGFTSISESHPADIVVKMLNTYFDVIVHELISRNGHVDKFIGDAIMAVFKGDYQIERAVEACISIRDRVKEMRGVKIEGISFSTDVSIGINMGDMISGNIGSETIERLDYTVIGDVVNTASRFQSFAKNGQIIVSEQINQLIEEFIYTEPLGEVSLKNKEKPVAVNNVADFK